MPVGSTLLDLLRARGLDPQRAAVEHNGRIVPRSAFACATLDEADVIEIVQFVG